MKKVDGEVSDRIELKNQWVAIVSAFILAIVGILPSILLLSLKRFDPNDAVAVSRSNSMFSLGICAILILPPFCFYAAMVLFGARIITSFAVSVCATCLLWIFTLMVALGNGFAG